MVHENSQSCFSKERASMETFHADQDLIVELWLDDWVSINLLIFNDPGMFKDLESCDTSVEIFIQHFWKKIFEFGGEMIWITWVHGKNGFN